MSLLDVGTLSGTIELDDRLTSQLNIVTNRVTKFASDFAESLGPLAIGVGAVGTAILGLGASIVTLGVKGSEINDVTEGFDRLAGSVENANDIMKEMREGVVGTVTDFALMERANRLLAAGVKANADDFGVLTSASKVLANEGFGNLNTIMTQVDRAMMTGQITRLGRIGITVDLKKAELDYATSLGKTTAELTNNQSLEAKRMALLEATRKIVADAGEIQLSFADRINQVSTAVKNWVNNLESAIAKSSSVNNAFIAIEKAIRSAFGGSSQTVMEFVIKWVNRFADAVSTYGPPIIKAIGQIKDFISATITTVTNAWNAIPDWLKNIARDAALATAAAILTGKAISTIQGSMEVFSGQKREGGMSSLIDGWGKLSSMIGNTAKLFDPKTFEGFFNKFTAGRAAVNNFASSLSAAAGSSATFFAQLGTGVVVGASAVAVITAGYQAFKLWQENAERAASAAKQVVFDQANLERINTALGTSYKTIDEASRAFAENLKLHPPIIKTLTEAEKLLKDEQEAHDAIVNKLVNSLSAAAGTIDVTSEALEKLTLRQKLSVEAQAMIIPLLDQHIARNIALTESEKQYYEVVTASRINIEAKNVRALEAQKITEEQLQTLRNLGMAETEIAQRLGTTVNALKTYTEMMKQANDLTKTLAKNELALTGTAHEQRVAQYKNEYDEAVKLLDMRFEKSREIEKKLAELRDSRIANDGADIAEQLGKSREAAQENVLIAEHEFELMIRSGKTFNQEVWDAARQKIFDARDAVHGLGGEITKTMEEGKDAAQEFFEQVDKLRKAEAEAREARRTASMSMTIQGLTKTEIGRMREDMKFGGRMGSKSDDAIWKKLSALEDEEGTYAPRSASDYTFMISQQALLAQLRMWAADKERPPGLAKGGLVMVGEEGPEAVRLPFGSQVFPNGVDPRGGGAITNHFYVNGTAEESARKISTILIRDLKATRQFSLN